MLDAVFAALEGSAVAEGLRASRYAYPLVNAAHILLLASLFGAILALDLRLLGAFRSVPVAPFAHALPRVAATGLAGAILTGIALFSLQPFDYAAHPALPIKLALIGVGSAHAIALHRSAGWREVLAGGAVPPWLRASAVVSLACWTGAILAGRFLAF